MVELNRAVAVCLAGNPAHALDLLGRVEACGELARYGPLYLARADILCRLGRNREARECYERALELADNQQVRRFIERRLQGA